MVRSLLPRLLLLVAAAALLVSVQGFQGDLLRPFGIDATGNQDALVRTHERGETN